LQMRGGRAPADERGQGTQLYVTREREGVVLLICLGVCCIGRYKGLKSNMSCIIARGGEKSISNRREILSFWSFWGDAG